MFAHITTIIILEHIIINNNMCHNIIDYPNFTIVEILPKYIRNF
jgi:hypothetical protein